MRKEESNGRGKEKGGEGQERRTDGAGVLSYVEVRCKYALKHTYTCIDM